MNQEITNEYSKKAQEDAEWAYNNAMEKFYYSMLEVIFLRIKSHLSHQGLKKVIKMDEIRSKNEKLSVEFSQKTWAVLAESWASSEGLAMKKIADLYELEIADFDVSKIESLKGKANTPPRCDPTSG
ncbi:MULTISPECIES: hypothetical protein [unclassified Prochlorococcus]|uniref:hypothetical protein n=1 Tax=unclassified Prochlorococcus TaxID=2627481 RepID=UPI0005339124|nr:MULTISPECIES: hypothetical protein [unclassified Prochlorococcus]KGG14873.1 putative protein family PM-9 [Prochlorococcus sp. MIT 0602]KGG15695.1 putative protein family PM-9 [Prochlorococcus sp. MIT 0603]